MYTISEETADEDLPQAWSSIIARVNKKTNWDLNEKSVLSINQVILKINQGKDDKLEPHEKAKKIWKTTLVCVDRLGVFVQRFGAFAAQAASVVFGPSQQCFNAINFVISAAQQYKEVFSNITVLFERVSVFLENLNMYMDNNNAEVKLDKRLRKTVYRVLEHLVEILGTTHSLTTDWKARMKLKAKSFAFGEDEGIKASLATLETLVSDFTGAQISMIVQDLSEAARNIRGVDKKLDVLGEAAEKQTSMLGQLTAADDKRKANEQEKKDLETILKALSIDDSKRSWDRQEELSGSRVEGTGEWFLEKTYYALWSDPKATAATEVLAIKAPPGFGKSHLSNIVIQDLQHKHRADSRTLVTWYYFQRETGEKISPLNKAVKTIVSQIAKSNSEYRKAAARACESGIDYSRTADIFKRLITDIAKNDVTLYIVLDGIDELEKEPMVDIIDQIRSSASKTSQLKIRILLTGTKEVLDPVSDAVKSTLPEVNLEAAPQTDETSMNERDLLLYVEARLKRTDRLQKVNDELKARIKRELASGARGAYSRLDYLLDDLVNIQNTTQIDDILKRANQSLPEIIAGKISILNNTLTKEEVREVNELLSWNAASFEYLNVSQCEAVLSLRADGQSIGLDERIRKKYAELLTVDDDKDITLREGIQSFLSDANEAVGKDDLKSVSTEAVQGAEVALVRKVLQAHFKHVFGDEEVYSRFQFEDFFQKKLGDTAVLVRLNLAESHIKIAQGCLVAMCDKYEDAQCRDLLPYAYKYFVDHIGEINIETTDALIRQEIGRKLVRLLQEPALIESWWTPENMYLRRYFVYTAESKKLLQFIHSWLKDPAVQKGMSDMPNERREWVAMVTAGESPSFDLYSKVAKIMAARWFEFGASSGEWDTAFSWLRGWTTSKRGEEAELGIDVSAEVIGEMELWAKSQLGNEDQTIKWHICIARTLLDYSLFEPATSRLQQAIDLRPDDWQLKVEFAEALGLSEEYDEAVKTIEAVIQSESALLNADETFTRAYFDRLLPNVGNWKFKKSDFAAAEIAFQQVLDHGLQRQDLEDSTHKAVLNMLAVLNKQCKFDSVIDLLNQLAGRTDSAGHGWIAVLFQEYWADDSFHNHLLTAAKRSSRVQPIVEKYEHAIQAERLEELGHISLVLQLAYGALLWTLGTPQEQDTALEMWEQIIFSPPNEEYAYTASYARVCAARYMSSALLSKAKVAGLSYPLNSLAQVHALRLEKITDFDLGQVFSAPKDPRLLLGRLYHLAGHRKRAMDILRDYLIKAFEDAEGQTEQGQANDGYYRIAVTLQAIDDDVNATVAWCQYGPTNIEQLDGGASDTADETRLRTSDSDGAKPRTSSVEPKAIASAPRENTNGVFTDNKDTLTNGFETDCRVTSEADAEAVKTTLKGTLGNSCDGLCGVEWTYVDDMYVCKDCPDVQFDPVCYQKLKAGELDVPICGRNHNHIHIPPFNEQTWRSTPKDHVIVNGDLITRRTWLESIRREWRIDAESLNAEQRFADAAHKIQRAWKIHKAVAMNN